jgi:hypothetical protein
VNTYTIDDAQTHDDYTHGGGSVEGYWLTGARTDALRWELRAAGAFDYYDTTTFPKKDSLSNFYDFDSRMGRGTALAGVRWRSASESLFVTASIGVGLQYEDPDTTTFKGKGTLSLKSDQNVTAQGTVRAQLRWRFVPQVLGARLRTEALAFQITREELSVASDGAGGLTTTSRVDQQRQIDVRTRAFIDGDVASFAGFVPAVFAGLDYLGISGANTSENRVIPVFGVGIVRY